MTETVRSWVAGRVGRVELDRQQALNALDLTMIRALRRALDAWREDPAVEAVVVTGAGRAFCAGGDVRGVREQVLAGEAAEAEQFFVEEYALNAAIACYPKPYVAILDGVAMGGGLGVSVHGSVRVATERAVLAMPETAIGFAPDVGTSHVLPRLPGALGFAMALAGVRLDAPDALESGLATHYTDSADVPDLLDRLEQHGLSALETVTGRPAGPGSLAPVGDVIAHAFSAPSVETVFARLDHDADDGGPAGEWAAATAASLRTMSPTSLVTAHELLGAGATSSLAACLERERRAAHWLIGRHDFAEGVRAVLVDKDRTPAWSPATLGEVDTAEIRDVLTTG